MYKVSVTNLTYAQPMSPMAVSLHDKSDPMFEIGMSASEALELLAEGGDNSGVLEAAQNGVSGNGLILPGSSDTVTIEGNAGCISIATMLVNTNDAFAGAECIDVGGMKMGETKMFEGVAYDAGTEANSESAATIPGPAGGGEGYNLARDDRDFVSVHGGVLTQDDTLGTSALNAAHRWDNPAVMISIERL